MEIQTDVTETALATIDHNDGYAAAAAEADQHLLQGQIIKFVDGTWTLNRVTIAPGTQFVPVKLSACWVKWENQKPVEHVWPRPNGLLPARETLGDLEESSWPAGLDGKPKDPWQNTRFIYLTNRQTAETNTFTNSTAGIRHCYSALAQAVATMRRAHPHALPIVELDSTPMRTKVGTKLRPHFKIVGWKQGGPSPQQVQQIENRQDDMDDAIPF